LAGDVEAFSVLVQRHRDAVYNLAYSLCGDSAAAEDAAQEAFLRAYRKLSQYKPRYLFRNWVLGICAHVCRSGYRSRERKRRLEQAYADDEGLWREERAQRDDGGNEARAAVADALASLPDTLRVPLVLMYMENMSIQEIAEVLHLRLSAVKMRLARGRKTLEAALVAAREGAG